MLQVKLKLLFFGSPNLDLVKPNLAHPILTHSLSTLRITIISFTLNSSHTHAPSVRPRDLSHFLSLTSLELQVYFLNSLMTNHFNWNLTILTNET